ncbi:DUF732 domain-containing protein [Nonomuraea sp. LPB2021202275-12-8]|uniref:DUF732 domain-containing protein n=1 Tax=Nonomuraea sp. LPB2021202275-12-8 TaxID=3120159 RepID=UPI00300C5792
MRPPQPHHAPHPSPQPRAARGEGPQAVAPAGSRKPGPVTSALIGAGVTALLGAGGLAASTLAPSPDAAPPATSIAQGAGSLTDAPPPDALTATSSPAGGAQSMAGVPTPTREQRSAYLARLTGIAPWLVAEEGRSVPRARGTCSDIVRGRPDTEVIQNAQERFTDVTAGEAARIVQAVRRWCAP